MSLPVTVGSWLAESVITDSESRCVLTIELKLSSSANLYSEVQLPFQRILDRYLKRHKLPPLSMTGVYRFESRRKSPAQSLQALTYPLETPGRPPQLLKQWWPKTPKRKRAALKTPNR